MAPAVLGFPLVLPCRSSDHPLPETTTRVDPDPEPVWPVGAVQLAVVPPLTPLQVQAQGEALLTTLAMPDAQRLPLSMNTVVMLAAAPQAPFANAGVTLFESEEAGPGPAMLEAVTLKV